MPSWEMKDGVVPFNLATWIITAPWAHPVWSQYALFLIHLRDEPGFAAAQKVQPNATHEVSLWAIAPDIPIKEGEGIRPNCLLQPHNFVGQFASDSDAAALDYVRKVVQLIDERKVSPDTDYRRQWITLFPFNEYE